MVYPSFFLGRNYGQAKILRGIKGLFKFPKEI